jgi:hypothetical protein
MKGRSGPQSTPLEGKEQDSQIERKGSLEGQGQG